MAKDLDTMRQTIWRVTGSTSKRLPTAALTQIINDVIQDTSRRGDFSYDEEVFVLSFEDGSVEEVLPTNVKRIMRVQYNNIDLPYMRVREFVDTYPDPLNSTELNAYTIFDGAVITSGAPNSTLYDLEVWSYTEPTDLLVSDETNAYLTNEWEMIKFGVLAKASIELIEDKRFPLFSSQYESLFRRFAIDQERVRHVPGRLESTVPGGSI